LIVAWAVICAAMAVLAQTPATSSGGPAPKRQRTKFDHAFHARLGDVSAILKAARDRGTHPRPDGPPPGKGCEACHSGVATGVAKPALAMMGDCLVCHPKADPPFSCSYCHVEDGRSLKPSHHTTDFLDKHSAGLSKLRLEKTECAVCHGRKFTCLGCHG